MAVVNPDSFLYMPRSFYGSDVEELFWPDYDPSKTNINTGLGGILNTVSEDTEDTAHSCILSVSKMHFQPPFIYGICI